MKITYLLPHLCCAIGISFFLVIDLSGRPVPFREANSLIVSHDSMETMLSIQHGLSRTVAPGLTLLDSSDQGKSTTALLGHVNWLLHRTNAPSYQANVFLTTAAGGFRHDGSWKAGTYLALAADAEDRRRYAQMKFSARAAEDISWSGKWTTRVGFAPYEAGFNDLNTWIILQTDRNWKQGQTSWEVTPLVRFFYRTFLVEGGVSFRGQAVANGMMVWRF